MPGSKPTSINYVTLARWCIEHKITGPGRGLEDLRPGLQDLPDAGHFSKPTKKATSLLNAINRHFTNSSIPNGIDRSGAWHADALTRLESVAQGLGANPPQPKHVLSIFGYRAGSEDNRSATDDEPIEHIAPTTPATYRIETTDSAEGELTGSIQPVMPGSSEDVRDLHHENAKLKKQMAILEEENVQHNLQSEDRTDAYTQKLESCEKEIAEHQELLSSHDLQLSQSQKDLQEAHLLAERLSRENIKLQNDCDYLEQRIDQLKDESKLSLSSYEEKRRNDEILRQKHVSEKYEQLFQEHEELKRDLAQLQQVHDDDMRKAAQQAHELGGAQHHLQAAQHKYEKLQRDHDASACEQASDLQDTQYELEMLNSQHRALQKKHTDLQRLDQTTAQSSVKKASDLWAAQSRLKTALDRNALLEQQAKNHATKLAQHRQEAEDNKQQALALQDQLHQVQQELDHRPTVDMISTPRQLTALRAQYDSLLQAREEVEKEATEDAETERLENLPLQSRLSDQQSTLDRQTFHARTASLLRRAVRSSEFRSTHHDRIHSHAREARELFAEFNAHICLPPDRTAIAAYTAGQMFREAANILRQKDHGGIRHPRDLARSWYDLGTLKMVQKFGQETSSSEEEEH